MTKFLKFISILILISPFIFFFHSGFAAGFNIVTLQALLFSMLFASVSAWPDLRRYVFILSAVLIIGMAPLYVFNIMDWANILGSTGVGFVLLLILSYLPDFVKKGYIEKI